MTDPFDTSYIGEYVYMTADTGGGWYVVVDDGNLQRVGLLRGWWLTVSRMVRRMKQWAT